MPASRGPPRRPARRVSPATRRASLAARVIKRRLDRVQPVCPLHAFEQVTLQRPGTVEHAHVAGRLEDDGQDFAVVGDVTDRSFARRSRRARRQRFKLSSNTWSPTMSSSGWWRPAPARFAPNSCPATAQSWARPSCRSRHRHARRRRRRHDKAPPAPGISDPGLACPVDSSRRAVGRSHRSPPTVRQGPASGSARGSSCPHARSRS